PTSREEKYKAKQAIDTFFVRSGDLLSAAIVFLGTSVLRLSIARFALVNIAMILMWIGVALLVLRRHQTLVQRQAEAAWAAASGRGDPVPDRRRLARSIGVVCGTVK